MHGLIDTGRMSYTQYLLPAVVVQSMIFVALLTADRAARDHLSGLGARLRTLPIAAAVPVSARIVATLIRAALALSAAMIAGYAFGFRMTGGLGYALAFVLIALLLCLAVALGADALGSSTSSVEGASQLLVVPQLLLFMLSTGIAPEKTFPGWLRPFVRNQPVSQVAETLRSLATGHVAVGNLTASLAWCVGMLLVFGAITLRMQRRSRVTPRPGMQGSLLTQSWLQAGRLLTRWRRDPAVADRVAGLPCLPPARLQGGAGRAGAQGHRRRQHLRPRPDVRGAMAALFGALGSAVSIPIERESGLLSRMWVLPVHRASALTGRLTAEAVRALIGTVLITAVGVTMGLRFAHGWPTALAYILIPPIVVVGFTALVMALAIRANGRTIMTWLAAGTTSLAFVNSGTTPIGLFPDWLRPLVRVQPMSPPIEVMRALAHDGPLVWPLALTLIWAIVLLAVFIPLAVRGYRVAAESSA